MVGGTATKPVAYTGAGTPSFWLDQLGPLPRRPAVTGTRRADVCIVGGGFTGLWTAYELRRADPGLSVVVLEAEHVGFGASGRNGGWVLGQVSGSASAWRRRAGAPAADAMAAAIRRTVTEIGEAVEREGIDCDWRRGGSLTVAQNQVQLERLRHSLKAELAPASGWRLLDAAQLRQRLRVSGGCGALFTEDCARVQPAKLVHGLAAAAERAGAEVHEGSRVEAIAPGSVRTAAAEVQARWVVVATEGYTANLPDRHRQLLPLNSAMIVTEPLAEEIWQEIGWEGAETLLDGCHVYTYSQRTADGRIAIGGRGVPYRYGSRTDREGPVPAQTVAELRDRLRGMFPVLGDVPVARAWHGVLGVARDWCGAVGFDREQGLAFAGGYAGEGVAASNLAARTLRDLILGRDSELSRLPWVNTAPRAWEPEPLRFLGARGIYRLYREADRRELRTGRSSRLATVADAIAGR